MLLDYHVFQQRARLIGSVQIEFLLTIGESAELLTVLQWCDSPIVFKIPVKVFFCKYPLLLLV